MKLIKELTIQEVRQMLREANLSEGSVPYRGYATTISDDGKVCVFIGHSPEGKYLLQQQPSNI
jgi:hypothetical protein